MSAVSGWPWASFLRVMAREMSVVIAKPRVELSNLFKVQARQDPLPPSSASTLGVASASSLEITHRTAILVDERAAQTPESNSPQTRSQQALEPHSTDRILLETGFLETCNVNF